MQYHRPEEIYGGLTSPEPSVFTSWDAQEIFSQEKKGLFLTSLHYYHKVGRMASLYYPHIGRMALFFPIKRLPAVKKSQVLVLPKASLTGTTPENQPSQKSSFESEK